MIVFVGDSFCAEFKRPKNFFNQPRAYYYQHDTRDKKFDSWIDFVQESTGLPVDCHGYAGQSWWFSWKKFWDDWSDRLQDITAIVFCHTSVHRINSSLLADGARAFYSKHLTAKWRDFGGSQQKAVDMWYKHLYDGDFQYFAQEYYFQMIKEKLSHIKTIHFRCFNDRINMERLPGMIFSTPLIHIAVAGSSGNKEAIDDDLARSDDRVCHMTKANNLELGQLVVDSLDNYCPGHAEIDMSRFTIVNPNYKHWPDGVYWNL